MTDKELMQEVLEFLVGGDFAYPTKLATDLRERLAQPEQEPVAVTYKEVWESMNSLYAGDIKQIQIAIEMGSRKLYTTPQPAQRTWVGLTDEEIESINCVYLNWMDYEQVEIKGDKEFARAIEAKLKEKNT